MAGALLPLFKDDRPVRKCFFTHTRLPNYIDPAQLPTAKKPFSSINALRWIQDLSLILPSELEHIIKPLFGEQHVPRNYAQVMMSLSDVIETDFLSHIKTHNVDMISEGRPGVDNRYHLHEGILRLEVDKTTYERAGLVGKPIDDGGRKHKDSRYMIEANLRLPSMLHGKKGFERFKWAFKNVLNESLVWLYAESEHPTSNSLSDQSKDPLAKHHPIWHDISPHRTEHKAVRLPTTLSPISTTPTQQEPITADSEAEANPHDDPDYAAALEEWLSLVCLASPRILQSDSPDPFLSRYTPPAHDAPGSADEQAAAAADVVTLRWRGLIPSREGTRMLLVLLGRQGRQRGAAWAGLQMRGFAGDAVSLLLLPDAANEALVWEHPPSIT